MPSPEMLPPPLRGEAEFRWRGGDVSRLEALTDAAFAFALAMLAISSDVPRDFAELKERFVELPVFLACAAMMISVWYFHYRYHRRFGLEDFPSVLLNFALLLLVLFYVYPLKYMATLLWTVIRGADPTVVLADGSTAPMIRVSDGPILMYVYGGGFAAIYLILTLMYVHAWRRREALGLDERERWYCRAETRAHVLSTSVGLLACAIVSMGPRFVFWAGMSFFLLPVGHAAHGMFSARQYRRRFGGS